MAALAHLGTISCNRQALLVMLAIMFGATGLGLCSTALYQLGALPGLAWQLLLGVSIFVSYSVMGTPFFDRMLAATRTEGTCSFLIFLSDFCGYCVSVTLLLYQDFAPQPAEASNDHSRELHFFLSMFWGCTGGVIAMVAIATAYFTRHLPRAAAPLE